MARSLLLLAVSLLAAGCSGCSDAGGGSAGRLDESLAVYEAAFRHQLKDFDRDTTIHLAINDREIPGALLNELRRDWPNLKQASEGEKGKVLVVYAERIEWDGLDAAVVKAGYWMPTKFAGQARFGDHRIVRKSGKWVVESVANEVVGCG